MIKEMFQNKQIDDQLLAILRSDKRKGVEKLVKQFDRKQEKIAIQRQLFEEKWAFDHSFCVQENDLIAGVDEAGRGPLAGPVVAAAVILPKDFTLIGLTDSKQLTVGERNLFFNTIKNEAISYHITVIDNQQIDQLNILGATKKAMIDALQQLNPAPHIGLIDAVPLYNLSFPTKEVIKGDDKSMSIAAASVLAKVTRDRLMDEIAIEYPQYSFEKHKGYGTKQHLEALATYGPSPYHRQSFSPVMKYI